MGLGCDTSTNGLGLAPMLARPPSIDVGITSVTGQSVGSLPLSMYKVIAAYKPEDTTIAKVLLHLRKYGGAIAHPAPLVPTPMPSPLLCKSH